MKLFLKGIVTIAGALIAFVVATIVFVVHKTNALQRPEGFTGQVGVDIKVVWLWLLNSPWYWAVVLTLLALSVFVFRRWVLH